MDCRECDSYRECTTLCEPAEEYVNVDYVKPEELYVDAMLMDTVVVEKIDWYNHIEDAVGLTRTERKILTLLGFGLGRYDIRQLLNMTAHNLSVHIYNLRKKIRKS